MTTEWAVREKAGSRVSDWPRRPLRRWDGMDSEAEAVAFIRNLRYLTGPVDDLEIVSREVGPWRVAIAAEEGQVTRDWLDEQMDAADHDCDVRNAYLEDEDDPEPADDELTVDGMPVRVDPRVPASGWGVVLHSPDGTAA